MDIYEANAARRRYAAEHDMDVMYAENAGNRYATWTYSDGVRIPMQDFYTLEGLQRYAQKHRYAIIYVN